MTVEKFKISEDEKEFTISPNFLLQNLKNAEALGLYLYFSSLPPDWIFHKKVIRNHFNFGRDKLDKLLLVLEEANLITTNQVRNTNGRFKDWTMHVHCPRHFSVKSYPQEPFTDFQGTDKRPVNTTSAPFTEITATDKPVTGKQHLQNKQIQNTKLLQNKQKSFSPQIVKTENEKKHEWADKPKSPMADVTKQSTSYQPNGATSQKASTMLEEFMKNAKWLQSGKD